MKLTIEIANKIYDILVKEAGAPECYRDNFVYVESKENCHEYRFQGDLGFGGKFWNDDNKWYVACYAEDETPERLKIIETTNKELQDFIELINSQKILIKANG